MGDSRPKSTEWQIEPCGQESFLLYALFFEKTGQEVFLLHALFLEKYGQEILLLYALFLEKIQTGGIIVIYFIL